MLNLINRMAGLFAPVPSARPGSLGDTPGANRIQEIGRPEYNDCIDLLHFVFERDIYNYIFTYICILDGSHSCAY